MYIEGSGAPGGVRIISLSCLEHQFFFQCRWGAELHLLLCLRVTHHERDQHTLLIYIATKEDRSGIRVIIYQSINQSINQSYLAPNLRTVPVVYSGKPAVPSVPGLVSPTPSISTIFIAHCAEHPRGSQMFVGFFSLAPSRFPRSIKR